MSHTPQQASRSDHDQATGSTHHKHAETHVGLRRGHGFEPRLFHRTPRRQEGVRLVKRMGHQVQQRQLIGPQAALQQHEPHLCAG